MITAHPLEFVFLQHPQERDLRFRREFADLVQEERPAVSRFKPPQTPLQCTSEGSFFVPEKLGRNQRLGNRGAVHAEECSGSAFRSAMQRARNQLFACSGFAQNENCRIGRRNFLSTCFNNWRIGFEEPTISSNIEERSISSRRTRFSFRSCSSDPLPVVDVGCCSVPADNATVFVFQRVVLNQLPAILSVLK